MQSFFMWTTKNLIRLHSAQADLSLYWVHMSEGTFSHVAAHINPDPLIRIRLFDIRDQSRAHLFNLTMSLVNVSLKL